MRNRHILDNVLIAYKQVHALRSKRSDKERYLPMKLDMSKVYDRVEWTFLMGIMLKMGFSNSWCNMIYRCISSFSYSILLNGHPRDSFSPNRGLR